MKKNLRLNAVALALLLAGSMLSPVWAGSTPTTTATWGSAPSLSASNSQPHTVDFGGIFVTPASLSTGDTVVMTYHYIDAEGDVDDSLSTVAWYYTLNGTDVPITAMTNVAAIDGAPGTSTITIPAGALGASAIKVEIWEQAKTGIPLRGQQSILVLDTSKGTGAGGGGGTATPPGPIVLGNSTDGIAGGIFLASDNPHAGSGATDYSRTTGKNPKVGETYLFRAWQDTNGNGVWDAGEQEVTAQLRTITWKLDGTNTAAAGGSTPVTLSNHSIPGATTDRYIVPVNTASSSGAPTGDQGFGLKVGFE
ncbi:SinI family autotransporter-associated protein [Yersinia intermedia]|uniref:SinI family autotransporter-associated protein n=1 Tax=Yersinia intermedia TaxID=631 RepID=UPI001643E971|nr:SinI family autotransporter-associated protein [Yersinia intermedia]MCW8114066.1 SinI family autotransporter-associated protein [Yersinia intermedia]MDA5483323.1 SinI family autotransporter-associated protein [Yersinia intermedia]MDA5518699.1 SinI family autotransporter-associated protein [Yersinia intermedia]